MVYGNEVTNPEEQVVFRFEFDDRGEFSEKDMFYMMYRMGVFGLMTNVKKFWVDKKFAKEVLKRDKETDKLYKKYQKVVNSLD